jgi:hypothetical protein
VVPLKQYKKKPAQRTLKQVLLSLAVFLMRPQAEFKSALIKAYAMLSNVSTKQCYKFPPPRYLFPLLHGEQNPYADPRYAADSPG